MAAAPAAAAPKAEAAAPAEAAPPPEHERMEFISGVPLQELVLRMDEVLRVDKKSKQRLLTHWFGRLIEQGGAEANFYPLMRLLMPQYDRHRSSFGMRERQLGATVIRALRLADSSRAVFRLRNYKKPEASSATAPAGDFCAVLYDVLRGGGRCAERNETVTLGDANEYLDRLAEAAMDKPRQDALFVRMLSRLTARQVFWIARVITKDLKAGVGEDTLLKWFHPCAQTWFNSCANLRRVCAQAVADPTGEAARRAGLGGADGAGAAGPVDDAIEPFQPFLPMLADNVPWRSIVPSKAGRAFVVEPKFDGERILAHVAGGKVRLFSRNAHDLTERYGYGAVVAPLLLGALHEGVDSCILDGELLAWDEATGHYRRFGDNRTVARVEGGGRGGGGGGGRAAAAAEAAVRSSSLCYMLFDCLYMNGHSLLREPLVERRRALEGVVPEGRRVPHRLELAEQRTDVRTTEDLMGALDDVMARGLEGLVIKSADSWYFLNNRSSRWLKLKPDYVRGMQENLDVVVVGGFYGEGTRRAGDVSTFLLAVAADKGAGDPHAKRPARHLVFGKVGTGYTLEQLRDLRARMLPHGERLDHSRPAPGRANALPQWWLDSMGGWQPRREDLPDVVWPADRGVVLEVKCGEVVECETSKFNAGFTVRFPRVERVRDDKEWWEGATLDDVRMAHESAKLKSGRAMARKRAAEDAEDGGDAGAGGKKRKKRRGARDSGAPQRTDVSGVRVEVDLLRGASICVVNGDEAASKADLEVQVTRLGGTFVENPVKDTFCVLYGKRSVRVSALVHGMRHNVVHYRWLLQCADARQLLPVTAGGAALFVTPEMEGRLAAEMDEYGDHYWQPATEQSLLEAMERAGRAAPPGADAGMPRLSASRLGQLLVPRRRLFRGCVVYLDHSRRVQTGEKPVARERLRVSPLDMSSAVLKMFGATIARTVRAAGLSHAVVDPRDLSRVADLRRLAPQATVVLASWVSDSARALALADPAKHAPPP